MEYSIKDEKVDNNRVQKGRNLFQNLHLMQQFILVNHLCTRFDLWGKYVSVDYDIYPTILNTLAEVCS